MRVTNVFARAAIFFAAAVSVTVSVGSANAACMFRVTGWEPTDEGVLLARYAAGVTGPALLASTRYAGRDAAVIKAAFDSVRLTFDMNGDNDVNAVDTTIVLRYVTGIRGNALTQGLNLAGGTRASTIAIQAFIDSGCVAPIVRRAPLYLALSATADRASFLSQANTEGDRAFVFLSSLIYGATQSNLYANDTPGVFTYRSLDTPSTKTAFEGQLNSQGAERYRFGGVLTSGSYFYRDENSDRTFSYRLLPSPGTTTEFLTQANAQGAEGYFYFLPYFVESSFYAIYAKESGTSTYSYALQPSTDVNSTADDFVAQANTQGANGFKFRTSFQFSDGSRNIYVKDTSQAATFSWKHNQDVASASALVTQANAEGVNGFVYLGSRVFFPNGFASPSQTRIIYFSPLNCAGSVLCSPGGPF